MGRLADALRRRLRQGDAGAPPPTLPGIESGEEAAVAAAAKHGTAGAEPPAPEPVPDPEPDGDAGARIDAARERLRARIEPSDPEAD